MDEIVEIFEAKINKSFEARTFAEQLKITNDKIAKLMYSFVRSFIKQIKESCKKMNTNISEMFSRQDNYIVEKFSRHENFRMKCFTS